MAASVSSLSVLVSVSECSVQRNETAAPGEDVISPCRAVGSGSVKAIEWTRDGSEPYFVLLYRDSQFDQEQQHSSYKNRVESQDREMRDGDVSLVSRNVNTADNGRYNCRVVMSGTIHLLNDPPTSTIDSNVSRHQKNMTAEPGQTITSPCKVTDGGSVTLVEWTRDDSESYYVLHYRASQFVTDLQHASYKNRVDSRDRQMKDGDVSLVSRNVTTADSGTYECRIFGNNELNLVATLRSHISQRSKSANIKNRGNRAAPAGSMIASTLLIMKL